MSSLVSTRLLAGVVLLTLAVTSVAGEKLSGAGPRVCSPERWQNAAAHLKKIAAKNNGNRAVAESGLTARSHNLTLISSVSLPGFNADVWAHRGFAYVGTWGGGVPDFCPATGVRIIDIHNPSEPQLIGAVAVIDSTTQEDVEVTGVETAFFKGDLLVVGVQACFDTAGTPVGPMGIDLWEITDPYNPQHLASWPSGGQAGVHELHLFQRGDRAYVAAAVPFSDFVSDQGDFRLVDVTDPRKPITRSCRIIWLTSRGTATGCEL